MLALAFLTIAAITEHDQDTRPAAMISITRNEIAFLFASLTINPGHGHWHRLRWSAWRRRYQYRAGECHYQRQAERGP